MQIIDAASPLAQSADLVAGNIEQLKALFPELITEGPNGVSVNVDVLKALVGDRTITDADEKYGLNWHGKRRARQLALTPSTGTLRPCPEESVDWDSTQNLMIEGDNLEVLKLLQKSYAGKVKLIYIDPPYNTGKDFVYPDNFQDNIKNYLELTGQAEGGQKVSSNTEASGRFHTDWLNMMFPRLKLARGLLRDNGVIFISIDEREYSALRLMCCDIFGEENIVGTVVWKNATDNNPTNVATEHEYLLVVAKKKESIDAEWKSSISDIKDVLVRIGDELTAKFKGQELQGAYDTWFREHKAELWPLDRYKYIDEGGVYTGSQSVHNPGREGYRYDVPHPVTKRPCKQPLMGYRFPKETMDELLAADRILFGEDESKIIELKVYASDFKEKLSSLLELDGRLGAYDLKEDFPTEGKVFTNPKPVRLYEAFLPFLLKDHGDLVVDFFAGSGATAKAVWKLNSKDSIRRTFCLVQLPEPLNASDKDQKAAVKLCDSLGVPRTISEITKERLRRAGNKVKADNPLFSGDTGFRVFKLDHSNIRAWNPNPADLEQTLFAHQDHLMDGRTESDILYELLLKLGLDLCVPIDKRSIQGKDVHSVGGGVLMACLAEHITRDDVEPLAQGIVAWHEELQPAGDTTCVFRDSAFADDVAKTNLAAILEQHGIQNVRSL
ncbi:site-specific DNA-methyltransferase [Hydrogenophaga sp.]|uniref:site-specific DNA-methyltransferase n=1 Tax=Hydrogenophaga sp. TaxID=1904254 RepID=UPI0027908048|nr:site-specific DNA-methyltransferase [Pseudomonas aeruginosa]HCF6113978.1 site-specific DNA-methyltransferase [Pseudomonas aeruginosa]